MTDTRENSNSPQGREVLLVLGFMRDEAKIQTR